MRDKQLLLAVLAQLEREKTVSIPQLAQLLGATEDDVYAALEILVFAYDSASIRLDLHDTYASLETYGSERLLRLTAQEAEALVDALLGAGFSQDDELVKSLLQTKAIISTGNESIQPRMRIISETGAPLVTQEVSAACEDPEHHVLEIAYQGSDDNQPELRHIEPVVIFSEEGLQYLLAFCRDADDWRSFRVDRIVSASKLEERFEPHEDIPPARISIEQDAQEAVIRLDASCAVPAWRGLKIIEKDEGSPVIGVPWTGSSWLPKRIVSFMGKAIPLSPATLVNACNDYANELLKSIDE